METFKVGDKVFCIDCRGTSRLILNDLYTISEVTYDYYIILSEVYGIEYCNWRFKVDIKSKRKDKLKKINDEIQL